MPYEVLEKQIKALPAKYYDELVRYIKFLTEESKIAQAESELILSEEESLAKMREAGIATVWEYLKNDTW